MTDGPKEPPKSSKFVILQGAKHHPGYGTTNPNGTGSPKLVAFKVDLAVNGGSVLTCHFDDLSAPDVYIFEHIADLQVAIKRIFED